MTNYTFSSGDDHYAVRVEKTEPATITRDIRTFTGTVSVSFGELSEVHHDGERIGYIEHGVQDIEIASVLYERESWTARTDAYGSYVGNIASEEEAARILLGMHLGM